MPRYYEFFCGGGMARAGLGTGWDCLLANDISPKKASAYAANWGRDHLLVGDINDLTTQQLPEFADLAWASFPCQDLSLAGNYAGIGTAEALTQTRSGTFWPFWKLMLDLAAEGRAPSIIVLENVYGILTAKGGKDFAAIGDCFSQAGYRFGALLIDAVHFVPQSRPRVFIVGVREDIAIPEALISPRPVPMWSPPALASAWSGLSPHAQKNWIWWNLPQPTRRALSLSAVLEDNPHGVEWHSKAETLRLIGMMSERNKAKLHALQRSEERATATAYKRTREGVQRVELRTDGIAGCLRTPAGGSSRQLVFSVKGSEVRSRLLSAREAASLMGLRKGYKLPHSYNDAYHVAGDGVVVPVVRHLAQSILTPIALAAMGVQPYAVAAE